MWVIDTPVNREAASRYWAQSAEPEAGKGITTFKYSESESRIEHCLSILSTIDEHHGQYTSHPYSLLEVVGLPLTDEVRSALKKSGFGT